MRIPGYFKEYAHHLTLKRVEINRARYEGTNKQRFGTKNSLLLGEVDREYYTEYIGILAELLVRDYCDTNEECTYYSVSTFIKGNQYVHNDADIKVKQNDQIKRISIKGCEYSLKANKFAIDNEEVDLVVFVLFKNPNEYDYLTYTPREIQSWKVNESFSSFYELKI